jgi:four helix bundle protein
MNNIAEGFGSQSNAEFKRFLSYARRSASEVQSCLYAALDAKFLGHEDFQSAYKQSEATRKVIDGLLRYLRAKRSTGLSRPAALADPTD